MARLPHLPPEFSPADQKEADAWRASRPPSVRAAIERCPPDRLYRLKSTGHRVQVLSYGEPADPAAPVTVTVSVDGRYNRVLFSRQVFGVSLDDLEETDPPAPGEDCGDTAAEAGYTEEDIRTILIPELKKRAAHDPEPKEDPR